MTDRFGCSKGGGFDATSRFKLPGGSSRVGQLGWRRAMLGSDHKLAVATLALVLLVVRPAAVQASQSLEQQLAEK